MRNGAMMLALACAAFAGAAGCGERARPAPPSGPDGAVPPGGPGSGPPPTQPFVPSPRVADPVPPLEPLPGWPVASDGRLHATWIHEVPAGREVWQAALDARGNLFWLETDRAGAAVVDLVSLSAEGSERFRVALAAAEEGAPRSGIPGLAVVGDDVVVSFRAPNACSADAALEARRASDGSARWRREIGRALAEGDPFCGAFAGPFAASADTLFVKARAFGSSGERRVLAAWSVADGRLLWSRPIDGDPLHPTAAPAVDEDGNVHVPLTGQPWEDTPIVSFTRDGELRFRASLPGALGILAIGSGALLAGEFREWHLLDASDGREIARANARLLSPNVAGSALLALDEAEKPATLFRATLGAERAWSAPLAAAPFDFKAGVFHTGPILTASGTLLVVEQAWAVGRPPYPSSLREVDVAGRDLGSAELAGVDRVREALLGDGWLYLIVGPLEDVRIHALALPGRKAAPHGWISVHGSMARDRRARAP